MLSTNRTLVINSFLHKRPKCGTMQYLMFKYLKVDQRKNNCPVKHRIKKSKCSIWKIPIVVLLCSKLKLNMWK